MKKNRIGIIVDDLFVQNWIHTLIEKIQFSHHSEVVVIVINNDNRENKVSRKRWSFNKWWLMRFINSIDYKIYKKDTDVLEIKKINHFPIHVKPEFEKKFNFDVIQNIEYGNLQEYKLDVVLDLGLNNLTGDEINSSKYGVWSKYFMADQAYSLGFEGIWEVLNNIEGTYVGLKLAAKNSSFDHVIAQSVGRTDNISITRNRNNYYWKFIQLILRKLEELHIYGNDFLSQRDNMVVPKQRTSISSQTNYPSSWEVFRKIFLLYSKRLISSFGDFIYFDQWFLLYNINCAEENRTKFSDFNKIIPPKDRFWADPFVLKNGNKYYIFIEEVIFSRRKGHISVIELSASGNYTNPIKILEKDYHLSYPFLIEDDGNLYMIPETSENNQIELYKCIEFPLKWEMETVIMEDVRAVDTTVYKVNETYWLFTNIKENEGISNSDELFLFYSDNLLSGDWKRHPMNPIVSNVQRSRPAGNILNFKGKLFRPSQDCLKRYGHGFNIAEISEMNKESYKEEVIESHYADWENGMVCTHTYNTKDDFTIIDVVQRRSRF